MPHILYLGSAIPGSTSYHRSQALLRLGNRIAIKDPLKAIATESKSKLWNAVHYRSGYRFVQKKVENWVTQQVNDVPEKYDLVWVNSGELLGRKCIRLLTIQLKCPVVLYNNDDPTGSRDGGRFKSLLKALPAYDLVVVVRSETEQECRKLNVKKVLRMFMSYDEVSHQPFNCITDIPQKFRSEVAFIGTWMPNENRDEFMLKLIQDGVPLSIWGDSWQKSKYFSRLQPYWRGNAVYEREYVAAIQGAKICIGMLSKGNRDLHTQRSLEIPFIGSLFCAERTTEHLAMYEEDKEAVFWKDAEECAAVCKRLLADEGQRERIRSAGMKRVREMKIGNEDICGKILSTILN